MCSRFVKQFCLEHKSFSRLLVRSKTCLQLVDVVVGLLIVVITKVMLVLDGLYDRNDRWLGPLFDDDGVDASHPGV